jgi:hypothetical protein
METPEYQYIGTADKINFSVASEEDKMVTLLFAEKDKSSLLVEVLESGAENPVSGASVNLTSADGDMDQTITTGDNGKVYFPDKTDPETIMENEEYQLTVSKEGFQDIDQSVQINDMTTVSVEIVRE